MRASDPGTGAAAAPPAAEKRLRIISSVLIGLGLTNTVRMLATGKRPVAKRGLRRR